VRSLLVGLSLLAAAPTAAQDAPRLHLSSLVEVLAEAGGMAPDGVRLPAVRLAARAAPWAGTGLLLQAELVRTPVLLDARLSTAIAGPLVLDAGLFITPFGREFPTPRPDLPMIERARVVRTLVPGRQVGASLRATLPVGTSTATLHGGLFNGNGGRTFVNDGDGAMALARAEVRAPVGGAVLRLGVSGATSRDESVSVSQIADGFAGRRTVGGADAELVAGRLWVIAEGVAMRLTPESAPDSGAVRSPWGGAVTASVEAARRGARALRVVGRADAFDADDGSGTGLRLAGGVDLDTGGPLRIQAEVGVPTDDARAADVQLLLRYRLR